MTVLAEKDTQIGFMFTSKVVKKGSVKPKTLESIVV